MPLARPLVLILVLLTASACTGAGDDPAIGTYRALASSTGSGVPGTATVTVADGSVTVRVDGTVTTVAAGRGQWAYPVCSTTADRTPLVLASAVTIGGVTFAEPGLFAGCAATSPARVVLVDLATVVDGGGVAPFAAWEEFCDTTDPDC